MITISNEKNFDNDIKGKLVILDFFATWCGPCRMLGQELEDLKETYEIVKIDVDENMNLAKTYGVMAVPTVVILDDGKELDKFTGYRTKDELIEYMKQFKK